jgi:hypothetical protein
VETILFRRNYFVLDCFVIVRSSTSRAQAIQVVPDVVEAELADLYEESNISKYVCKKMKRYVSYLVSTRTWSKVSVGEVELFHAKGADEVD